MRPYVTPLRHFMHVLRWDMCWSIFFLSVSIFFMNFDVVSRRLCRWSLLFHVLWPSLVNDRKENRRKREGSHWANWGLFICFQQVSSSFLALFWLVRRNKTAAVTLVDILVDLANFRTRYDLRVPRLLLNPFIYCTSWYLTDELRSEMRKWSLRQTKRGNCLIGAWCICVLLLSVKWSPYLTSFATPSCLTRHWLNERPDIKMEINVCEMWLFVKESQKSSRENAPVSNVVAFYTRTFVNVTRRYFEACFIFNCYCKETKCQFFCSSACRVSVASLVRAFAF